MSHDWADDIYKMHEKYNVHEWMENNEDKFDEFLDFRLKFIKEELDETTTAWQNYDSEEVIDGLIDLCVVAIGTLDAFGVDAHKAWDAVLEANMNKRPGAKLERPNPLGLPDLIKPSSWKAPSHSNNHNKFYVWEESMKKIP